jgi:hypothetical protein
MATDQQRRERVLQGSRRKRDLAVVTERETRGNRSYSEMVDWCKERIPTEDPYLAAAAALTLSTLGKRELSPELVLARMESQGRLARQKAGKA